MTGRLPRTSAKATGGERPEHRRLDGLFDIWLRTGEDGGLVALRGPATPLDAGQLADIVRRGGGAGDDVRVMMGHAGEHSALFAELAGILGRDVHISPAGSELRYGDGADPEPALVDAVNGQPVDWLVIQPPAMATNLPGWYEMARGVVRQRRGVVAAPLPGGITLATRADFVARRAAASELFAGHPELTTIGVAVRGGGFVVGDYTGSYQVADGRRLAAVLSDLPLYGGEVRMWMQWPSDVADRERLDGNLAKFAENTGAIVWAPERSAVTEILDSCQDLSATDRTGGPAAWRAYLPRAGESPRFESDLDGRLSPAGRVVATTYPGVPLVSVAPTRQGSLATRYTSLRAQSGLFHIDLTVLPDGRWAVQYADSGPHALGPRVLHRMLRAVGWQGEDLVLLASYRASAASGVRRYGTRLVDGLNAEVWVLPPDVDFACIDGSAHAVDRTGRPVAWQRLGVGEPQLRWRSDNGVLVAVSGPVRLPAAAGGAPKRPLPIAQGLVVSVTQPEPQRPTGPPPAADLDLPVSARPSLTTARRGRPHGIYWLADRPMVNAEPVELYVVCGCPPAEAVGRGVPTPHLFLVGTLKPPAPGMLAGGEHLLRVRVDPGGAVDTSSIFVHEPSVVQALLAHRGESYLLPGGLLRRARLVASYGVEASGQLAARGTFPTRPALALRCSGAEHGIAGLPGDLPRWPWETEATAYALLPGPDIASSNGALVLLRRRPEVWAGRRLLELRIPWRRAIDVRATAKQIAGLAQVRSAVAGMLAARVELLLPGDSYERVRVSRVRTAGRLGWRAATDSPTSSLADLLAAGRIRSHRPASPGVPPALGPAPGSH
ncbi:hypothetical protein [Dactylosporangium sp. CA-233914]|uniref:hypothetical protein n=1 Tax=Dactylosporangium sp. CA-233914 TaxID=3239934 RepID=UPI003D8DF6EA